MGGDWQEQIYIWFAKKNSLFLKIFPIVFLIWAAAMTIGAFVNLTHSDLYALFYSLGKHSGQAALALLGIVLLPGILGRFRIEFKITRVITLFRRQLGITVFLFGLAHYCLIRFFPMLAGTYPISLPVGFEVWGTFALFILFFLFLTSNNFSKKHLGPWWKRLHRFVYVAVWFLAFHVAYQRISVWSLYAGIFGVLEIASFIWEYFKKKQEPIQNLQQPSKQMPPRQL